MADNLMESGIGSVMLPLGLGVAAAAHPALARGASAITQSMSQFRQNKRLRDIMDMERENQAMKREKLGMEKETHDQAAETYEYEKSRRPIKESRARVLGTIATGGGGHQVLQLDDAGKIVPETINENWVGSPEWKKAQQFQTGQHKELQANQGAITLSNQQTLLDRKPLLTPDAALGRLMGIEQHIRQQLDEYRKSNKENLGDEGNEEVFMRNIYRNYGPEMDFLRQHVPNYPSRPILDAPPSPSYTPTKMKTKDGATIWIDQTNPMDKKKWWYPAVPYIGGF